MIKLNRIQKLFSLASPSFAFKNVKSLFFNIPQKLINISPNKLVLKTELPSTASHIPAAIQSIIHGQYIDIFWLDFCGYIYLQKNLFKQFELISDTSTSKWFRSQPLSLSSLSSRSNKDRIFILDNTTIVLFTGAIKLHLNPAQIINIMNQFSKQKIIDYSLYALTIRTRLNQKIKQISESNSKIIFSQQELQQLPFGIIFADIEINE